MIHPQHEMKVREAVLAGELEIDAEGRVWRVACRRADRWTGGVRVIPCRRRRAESSTRDGYLQVRVMYDKKRYNAAAHRLVYLCLVGPIQDGLTINHKNGRKADNRPDNLELATYSDQRVHAINVLNARHHDVRGEKHPKRQATDEIVREMRRRRAAGEQVKALAAEFGMTPKAVSAICRGTTWKHLL